jgi:TRAP-type mannitol/chloroaromatic compound transport system permease small subunit
VRRVVAAIEAISRLGGYVAAVLVALLIALMVYEVVVRYVLSAPTTWGYEVGTWVMGASFVLAIGYALATDSHVRVDFIHDVLGRRACHAFDLAGYLLIVLPLLAWVSWGLWEYFLGAFLARERTGQSAWNPVIWPFRLILFLGVAIWTLQTLAEIVKSALALAGRPLEADEPRQPTVTD